jgi:DNA-binding NarL/FixJ family response regulator
MLSGSVNVGVMRQVLSAGACGFVTKSSLSGDLLMAVERVMAGAVYLPPELLDPLTPAEDGDPASLTQRQEWVLRELLDGKSNREISLSMHISEETVKSHVTAILRHFDVDNRTQAVVAAAREGYRPLSSL